MLEILSLVSISFVAFVLLVLWALWVFGRIFEDQIRAFLDFVDQYQWWVVIGLFVLSTLQGQFRRRG